MFVDQFSNINSSKIIYYSTYVLYRTVLIVITALKLNFIDCLDISVGTVEVI